MNFSSVSHSHGLQFSVNCSSVGPFHGVSFLQKQTASVWICCRDESHQQSCSNIGSSLCIDPASNLLHGVLVSTGCIHLLQCGALHELEGDSLPLHGLHHELGKLCSGAWKNSALAPEAPASSLTLLSGQFLSHTLTPHLWLELWTRFFSPSYPCYHATAMADWLSFGQQFYWSYGKLLEYSKRSHTCNSHCYQIHTKLM